MDKSETKQAWQYDDDGKYVGEVTLTWMNRSPISGRWQIPAYCTTVEPPAEKDGYERCFDGTTWNYVEMPPEPEPEPEPEPTPEEKIAKLDAEYEQSKQSITLSYVDAVMTDDVELQEGLKEDLIALNESYDEQRKELEGAE